MLSQNEWGVLKSVIVGNPVKTPFPKSTKNVDLSFRLFYHDNLWIDDNTINVKKSISHQDIGFLSKQIENERIQDIENFVSVLQQEGITVYRPENYTLKMVGTNNWDTVNSPPGTVRDQCLVYKDYIIETSPQVRCRYFENEYLYPIFYSYMNKGAKWLQMPKSRMLDSNFDTSYITKCFESKTDDMYEIMFDGAQCLRFNDRLLVNTSTANHRQGVKWLRNVLGDVIDEVHLVDSHLDGTLMPVDEGTIIAGPKFYKQYDIKDLPKWLQSWDFIFLDDLDKSDADKMCLASETIFVNCLSLGNKKVVLNKHAVSLKKKLEAKGFDVIPLDMRHDRLYGGSFHCVTLDLERGS